MPFGVQPRQERIKGSGVAVNGYRLDPRLIEPDNPILHVLLIGHDFVHVSIPALENPPKQLDSPRRKSGKELLLPHELFVEVFHKAKTPKSSEVLATSHQPES